MQPILRVEKIFLDVFPIRVHLLTSGQRIGDLATRIQYVWASSSLSSIHTSIPKREIRSYHVDYGKFLEEVGQSIKLTPGRDALGWVHQSRLPDSSLCFLEIGGEAMLHKALATMVNSSKASMEAVDLYIFSPRLLGGSPFREIPEETAEDAAAKLEPKYETTESKFDFAPLPQFIDPKIDFPKVKLERPSQQNSLPAPILRTQKCRLPSTKRVHFSPPRSLESPSRHLASPLQTHASLSHRSSLNPPTTMSATSPPHSPLPKRQKPNPESPSQAHAQAPSQSIEAAMSAAEATPVPVTKVAAEPPLLIKKLSDKARLPTRGSAFAAGYDLYAAKDTVVPSRGKVLVDTDISMAVPEGTCLLPLSSSHLPCCIVCMQLNYLLMNMGT